MTLSRDVRKKCSKCWIIFTIVLHASLGEMRDMITRLWSSVEGRGKAIVKTGVLSKSARQ